MIKILSRSVSLNKKWILQVQILACKYCDESTIKSGRNYVFREVRNNSIIRDFAYGLVNPQLLKMPGIRQSDVQMKTILAELDNLPNDTTPSDCLSHLKNIGLFGATIPERYGGLGLCLSHYSTLLQHRRLIDWVLPLVAHLSLCAQTILEYGSEEQKSRYLPGLASGDLIGAFCLTESSSGSDMAAMETVAVLGALEDNYVLNGTKNWVLNGAVADVLVVFAVSEDTKYEGGRQHLSTVIVDRTMAGVSVKREYEVGCLPHSHLADVVFQDVMIPLSSVLGEDYAGYKVANHIQNNARCLVGACVVAWLRLLAEDIARRQSMNDREEWLVKDLINDSLSAIYAIESGLMFTTRFSDQYEVPEVEMEAAAVKVFSTEAGRTIVDKYLRVVDILGGGGLRGDVVRVCDALGYLGCLLGSNYYTRMYIGATMAQLSEYSFMEMRDRLKSPVENFSFVVAPLTRDRWNISWTDEIKDTRYSSVVDRSVFVEELGTVYRRLQGARLSLMKGMVKLRGVSGDTENILEQQPVIEALSDIGILTYIVSCCVARANIDHGVYEVACTQLVLEKVRQRIDSCVSLMGLRADQGQWTLLEPLSEDIICAVGYSAGDVLEVGAAVGVEASGVSL